MNVCIRCNPISELLTVEDGSQSCRYCGGNYLMESRPDPERAIEAISEHEALLQQISALAPGDGETPSPEWFAAMDKLGPSGDAVYAAIKQEAGE